MKKLTLMHFSILFTASLIAFIAIRELQNNLPVLFAIPSSSYSNVFLVTYLCILAITLLSVLFGLVALFKREVSGDEQEVIAPPSDYELDVSLNDINSGNRSKQKDIPRKEQRTSSLSKDQPERGYLNGFIFFGICAVVLRWVTLTYNETGNALQKYMQESLIVMLSLTSLLLFFAYIRSHSDKLKKTKARVRKENNLPYKIGDYVISFALSIILSLLILIISIPLLRGASNMPMNEMVTIGSENLRIVLTLYGVLVCILTYLCYTKRVYGKVSIIMLSYLALGAYLQLSMNNNQVNHILKITANPNMATYITERDSCDRDQTLEKTKSCVFRILRDDGGHGSGFVIKAGFLVTNRHVVEGASKLTVWTKSEQEVKLWNYSDKVDVAIIKLPESTITEQCDWFDSSRLNVAEELFAFGWPENATGYASVTKGIFSRPNKYDDGTEDIQTDAPINPGSSGGPLVNECGVVGINTARLDWTQEQSPRFIEGMGFALPSSYIHKTVDNLIATGSLTKDIPGATQQKIVQQQQDGGSNNQQIRYTLDISEVNQYLNHLYQIKSSWEQARGTLPQDKVDRLIDSFNRQIEFCQHLSSKLGGGQLASGDDIAMWRAVLNMSNESAVITKELNGR